MVINLKMSAAWPLGCVLIIGGIAFVASKQQAATNNYKRHRKEYCASVRSFTPEQEKTCEEESNSPSDYLPWGYKLVAWPEGIATWAFLATLGAIIWQAVETRRAATATADAASATYRSVAFAEAQFDLMKEKERGRLDIQSGSLYVLHIGEESESWYLQGTIRARNIGQSRVFIIESIAKLAPRVISEAYPEYDSYGTIPFADSFVDPDPTNAFADLSFTHFPGGEDKIRFLSEDLHAKRRSVHLYGSVDYETLGMRFRKEFGFVWIVLDPNWYLGGMTGQEQPMTDEQKIVSGYWTIDPERDKPAYPVSSDPDERQKAN